MHKKILQANLNGISIVALLAIIIFFGVKATYRGGVHWAHDYHTYHLPLALMHFNLSIFTPDAGHLQYYKLLPPLTHLIEGFLFWITGIFAAATLLGVIGLALFNFLMLRYLEPARLVVVNIFLLATPIIAINIPSGLNDIWTNLFLVVAFVALVQITTTVFRREQIHIADAALFLGGAAIAYYSKYQSWVTFGFLGVLASGLLCFSLYRTRSTGWLSEQNVSRANSHILAACVCIILLVGLSWPVRNWVVFNNLFMPFLIQERVETMNGLLSSGQIMAALELLRQSTADNFQLVFTPDGLKSSSSTTRYVASYFEFTRLLTPEAMMWNSSQWHGSVKSLHQMMGGLNGSLSLACLVLLIVGVLLRQVSAIGFLCLLALAALISTQAQSHEMRYWLVVPIASYVLLVMGASNRWYRRLVFVVPCLFLAMFAASDSARKTSAFGFQRALLDDVPEIEEFWSSHAPNTRDAPYCIPKYAQMPSLTDALYLYFNGPTMREFYVIPCRESGPRKPN
ncbi:MAG TPA: hypothetical protein VN989_11675 [Casimicrobiaceae bacterium]|nr:hypothetical protein [Casimicrobiaceae bacterium]